MLKYSYKLEMRHPIQNPLLLTLTEASSISCEDVGVIHPSGSTSLSVTNTRRVTQPQLSQSIIWLLPKGQLCHPKLSHKRNPSHVCRPCQKLTKYFPGMNGRPDRCMCQKALFEFCSDSLQVIAAPPECCQVQSSHSVMLVGGEQPAGRLLKGTLAGVVEEQSLYKVCY